MNKKPIIGIMGYIEEYDEQTYITLHENYRESIILSGGIPILILPTQKIHYNYKDKPSTIKRLTNEEKNDLETQIDLCDGIIFPGGLQWYEHHEYVFNLALKKKKSILGICLGMQMMTATMARKYGDGNYKNVKNETYIDHRNQPSNEYAHKVILNENTKIYKILKQKEFKVNSKHNYHIDEPKEFIVCGYAEDGIPEAIELPNEKFVIGVQWHPEKLIKTDEISKNLFSEFINSCKNER